MPIAVPAKIVEGSKIFIVGEAPGETEVERLTPFVGASGWELDRMLSEAGIMRSECSLGNVVQYQPPRNDIQNFIDNRKGIALKRGLTFFLPLKAWTESFVPKQLGELCQTIRKVNPNVIIALGNVPLMALCGEKGITNWRGSMLHTNDLRRPDGLPYKVIPTYHPAAVLRQWSWRTYAVHDLRRAEKQASFPELCPPPYIFHPQPSFVQFMQWTGKLLASLNSGRPVKISCDIETRRGQIACIGIGISRHEAMCVPFIDPRKEAENYWPQAAEECAVVERLRDVLTHKHALVVGQNFTYDEQYIAKQWGFMTSLSHDTMRVHHTLFPRLEKGLDVLSSLYCDFHQFWKEEGKEWHTKIDPERLWLYNCKDCVITYECSDVLCGEVN